MVSFVLVLNQYVHPSGFQCSVYVKVCTLDIHKVGLEGLLTHRLILKHTPLFTSFMR
jgi:hypothetical protein